jgi:hypothetical protein
MRPARTPIDVRLRSGSLDEGAPPAADDKPIPHDDVGPEDVGDRASPGQRGVEDGVVVGIGPEVLVIVRQELDERTIDLDGLERSGGGPVVLAVDRALLEGGACELSGAPDISHRQPGPPRHVASECRAVAPEVADGELGQCLVAVFRRPR